MQKMGCLKFALHKGTITEFDRGVNYAPLPKAGLHPPAYGVHVFTCEIERSKKII